jgi:hypothetical protein
VCLLVSVYLVSLVIAGTVFYLHMHLLVESHGQLGWIAALTPLSVDGMTDADGPGACRVAVVLADRGR